MADAQMVKRANKVIERLCALNKAIEIADAFCAYLKELTAHSVLVTEYLVIPSDVEAKHVAATRWVHEGIVRAAIATIMACLDPEYRPSDRASVGHIIEALKDKTLVDYFTSVGQGSTAALQQARESYKALRKSHLLKRAERLRNDTVGHILIRDTPTPKVRYEDVYDLRDAAERIVTDLIAACGRQKPKPAPVAEQAKLFWDTYLSGMASG